MTYEVLSRTVSVTLRWPEDDRPRFKYVYADKPAEWFHLTATARLPIAADDVRVEGRGLYVKKDGTTGSQSADMTFGRLGDVPEPTRGAILAELEAVAR